MVLRSLQSIGRSLGTPRAVATVNAARIQRPFAPETTWYDILTGYLNNNPYDVIRASSYKSAWGLPRSMRAIYNPAHRAVNWYSGHVYPQGYGDIPYADGTPPEIEAAVNAAFLTWGNWGRLKNIYVKTGAGMGNVLLEVESDAASGRIYPTVVHPKYVTDIELNHRGDVLSYTLELPRYDDETQRPYRYGKTVTRETVTTLYDGEPRGYDGNDATMDNPFPFVPAVWVPHTATGEPLGAPVIDGVLGKIDEVNRIVTSIHDYIGKFNRQGLIFATDGPPQSLKSVIDQKNAAKRGRTADFEEPHADSDELGILIAPPDTKVFKPMDNMGIGEAFQYVERLLGELADDLPETTLDKDLRAMSTVTGPGATRMTSDVVNRLAEAQDNYDWGLIRAAQMSITMGAILARSGVEGWRNLNDAQRAFLEFSENSWNLGELAFELDDRPLLTPTEQERAQTALLMESISTPSGLEMAGLSPKQIYGENERGEANAPERSPGIIAEKQQAARDAADASATRFNSGLGPF